MNENASNKNHNAQAGRDVARKETKVDAAARPAAGQRGIVCDFSEFLTRRKHGRTGLYLPFVGGQRGD
jgi:hypothetical protein